MALAATAFSLAAATSSEGATSQVNSEWELRRAWADPEEGHIALGSDIALRACRTGDPIRESPVPILLDGRGHAIRQTCFEKRVLRQDGTGFVQLENVTLTRGGSDGPGAAITTRGEIKIIDSTIAQNLAEEPGGGVFSMRKATIIRSVMVGNLANDDGGAVYARRGGVVVRDSILNANLVDGSGGAIGSTGDVIVSDSHVDGNTTDGDGGAIYTDEDGDVTVVNSTVDGSTADGPGGAIWGLEGDITIVNSTINGNRADDRGGGIGGEADVTIIGSTIARNLASAHVGGGVWARGNLYMVNSTVANNYAEGLGGGVATAANAGIAYSTISDNVASGGANISTGNRLELFATAIGPARITGVGATQPSNRNCDDGTTARSLGFNFSTDRSCDLTGEGDQEAITGNLFGDLTDNGGFGETRLPGTGSPLLDRVPASSCPFVPFGHYEEGEQHLAAFGIDPIAAVTDDQRGDSRPSGGLCDVGSVEAGASGARAGKPGPDVELDVPKLPDDLEARLQSRAQRAPSRADDPPDPPVVHAARARSVGARIGRIERGIRPLEDSVENYKQWRRCIEEVGVSESGDPDGRFGYVYDDVDGAGRGMRSALTLDRGGRADFRLLDFELTRKCRSDTTQPGGTAEDARAAGRPLPARRAVTRRATPADRREQEKELEKLEKRLNAIERAAGRFDEWESCLTAISITEYGDPAGEFGFAWERDGRSDGFAAANAIDISEWDDPDYQLLAFEGRDDPTRGGECGSDPGEGVDRVATAVRGRIGAAPTSSAARVSTEDLKQEAAALVEDLEDLREPVAEFEFFDQCMYTIGLSQLGGKEPGTGFVYREGGNRSVRPALAMDFDGFDRSQFEFMVFPGEEPPQIECNEDAEIGGDR